MRIDRDLQSQLERMTRGRERPSSDDFDQLGLEASASAYSGGALLPRFTALRVHRSFPLRYVETSGLFRTAESIGIALYQAEVRPPPIIRSFNQYGVPATPTKLVIRRMRNFPIKVVTNTTGAAIGPTIGHYLQRDIVLYPERWYYLGFVQSGTQSAFYGFYETLDYLSPQFSPSGALASISAWPLTMSITRTSGLAPAFKAYTRRAMLRYQGA